MIQKQFLSIRLTTHVMCRFFTLLITIMSLQSIFISCNHEDIHATALLAEAQQILESDPQKAYFLLDSIDYPENLNARQNAQWCMLVGKLADTLYTDLPYSHQLERAVRYFRRKCNISEQAHILLYLGRSYAESGDYENAMHVYLQAHDLALKTNDFKLTGYLDSYMGDVYEFKATYSQAKEKYLQAAHCFEIIGNRRSWAFALRDAGRQAAFSDSLDQALHYMFRADSLIRSIGNQSDIASITNGIGNIFRMKGEYTKAKYYFKQVIRDNSSYCLPDMLALTEIYISENELDSAQLVLKEAVKLSQDKKVARRTKDMPFGILYAYSLIEKKKQNHKLALEYLKEYINLSDSVTYLRNRNEIIDLETKYNHSKLSAENMYLKLEKNRYLIGTIFLLFL